MNTETITADGTLEIGGAGTIANGSKVIHIITDGDFDGSISVEGKVVGAPDSTYEPIPYRRRNLAGTASDDTVVSAAITDDALIEVNCTGLEVALVTSSMTAGEAVVYHVAVSGAR